MERGRRWTWAATAHGDGEAPDGAHEGGEGDVREGVGRHLLAHPAGRDRVLEGVVVTLDYVAVMVQRRRLLLLLLRMLLGGSGDGLLRRLRYGLEGCRRSGNGGGSVGGWAGCLRVSTKLVPRIGVGSVR